MFDGGDGVVAGWHLVGTERVYQLVYQERIAARGPRYGDGLAGEPGDPGHHTQRGHHAGGGGAGQPQPKQSGIRCDQRVAQPSADIPQRGHRTDAGTGNCRDAT